MPSLFQVRLPVLLVLCCMLLPAADKVLIVADEAPPMRVLAQQLEAKAHLSSEVLTQGVLPANLAAYRAVIVYIHQVLEEEPEKAFIAYARNGGRLILLHHTISSQKRANAEWFKFLGVELPTGDFAAGGYKYFEPVDFEVSNLAPENWITTHQVAYPQKGKFVIPHTEIYINHVLTGPRTPLLGFRFTDAKTGKSYQQDTAGWYKPVEKGWVFYFMPGHNAADFDNPAYSQILANAVVGQPTAPGSAASFKLTSRRALSRMMVRDPR